MKGFNPHKCPIHYAAMRLERAMFECKPERIKECQEAWRRANESKTPCHLVPCCMTKEPNEKEN